MHGTKRYGNERAGTKCRKLELKVIVQGLSVSMLAGLSGVGLTIDGLSVVRLKYRETR